MNILLLQTDIAWQQPEKNRARARQIIDASPAADVIVLPEMFTTGFCTQPKDVAEKANTETLAWMQHVAKEKNAALAGSLATEENGRYYNRFYFVKPDGSFAAYNKRHLFSYAGEHKEYTGGSERVIVEHCGVRMLLQVCYDLRFPVFARNRGDYDMILYVACWPTSRIEAWNTLLRARAIENQCYVAGVNRTGSEPAGEYSGGTALINYLGKTVATAESDKEQALLGSVDLQAQRDFRKKFPALDDADNFTIHV
jgi:predicted amidohydrolase